MIPLAKTTPTDPAVLFEDEATRRGGVDLLVWGFGTVAAVVLGFASWQYAPARPSEPETRVTAAPSAEEVTGSIAIAERGSGTATRVIGSRLPIGPAAPSEPAVTLRDLEQLRGDIRDLHRTIAQMGLSGDGVSRRIDRLEGRIDALAPKAAATPVASADPAPPPGPAVRSETVAAAAEAPAATDVRIPLPKPDADQPAITGSVPTKPPVGPAKADREAPGATPPVPPAEPVRSPNAAADAARVTTSAPTPNGGVAAVDLGGHRTLAALRRSWGDMSERYAEFGNGIEPLARLRETDGGMEVRLVAGPYPSPAEAAKICVRMRTLGVACAVTGYTGQPLSAIR